MQWMRKSWCWDGMGGRKEGADEDGWTHVTTVDELGKEGTQN